MTYPTLPTIGPAELSACVPSDPDAGLGALRTRSGNLPLRRLEVRARIVGLSSRVVLAQRFHNPHAEPLEATYVFPLPPRGAVTAMRMTADDRTVVADLREREQARQEYEEAIASGRRASITEEERPDVFTLRVGNILPGEDVTVELTVVCVLPVADGAATFRFPLVVAPRYVPGVPLPGDATGEGHQPDTDAVPDASRISPPVLLPGFPNPVGLDVEIALDPAGLPMGTPRSSLHAVQVEAGQIRFQPGEKPDRDIVLRIPVGQGAQPSAALTLVPDDTGESGTFELTVLPPDLAAPSRPRDVVLLLDRSGSMTGWKMVAARRAAARIVDTLTDHDRFAVIAFDDQVEVSAALPPGLAPATDRNRFRAVEFLAGLGARGGTELSEPMRRGLGLLTSGDDARPVADRVLVLVTDGQVGNEDQLLRAHVAQLARVRLHAVGVDQAVNAGFLGRLASLGGGRCELVESEDRLDEAMAAIHSRIGVPLVTAVDVRLEGMAPESDTITPSRLPDVFPGVPYVVRGRYLRAGDAIATLHGTASDGEPFEITARGQVHQEPAITVAWARSQLRDLEDIYATRHDDYFGLDEPDLTAEFERRIVATSLRFGVLCRFTAFVAIDDRVVTDGSTSRHIVQPVPLPAGWEAPAASGPPPQVQFSAMTFSSADLGSIGGGTGPLAESAPAPAPGAALRGGVARGFARSRAFTKPAPTPTQPADHDLLSQLLVVEVARLHDLVGQPDRPRRMALLDLGSRIRALAEGADDPRWEELITLLQADRVNSEPLETLWPAVLHLLQGLAVGQPGDPGPAPEGAPRSIRRTTFWKHRESR